MSQLFNFKDGVKYYQKSLNDNPAELKNGAGIVGNSLARGRDGTIVVGSPNFNLGDPTKECTSTKGKNIKQDCRFSGIGNILKFGKLAESKTTKKVFLNPSKEHKKNSFRQDLKREFNEKNQGTPSTYLGSTITTGALTNDTQ